MKVLNHVREYSAEDYGVRQGHMKNYPKIKEFNPGFFRRCVNDNIAVKHTYYALVNIVFDGKTFDDLSKMEKVAVTCIPDQDTLRTLLKFLKDPNSLINKIIKLNNFYTDIIYDDSISSLNYMFIDYLKTEVYSYCDHEVYSSLMDMMINTIEQNGVETIANNKNIINGFYDNKPFEVSAEDFVSVRRDIIVNAVCTSEQLNFCPPYFINTFIRMRNENIDIYRWMLNKSFDFYIDNYRCRHSQNKLMDIYKIHEEFPEYEEDYIRRSCLKWDSGISYYYDLLLLARSKELTNIRMEKIHEYGLNNMAIRCSDNISKLMRILDKYIVDSIPLAEISDKFLHDREEINIEISRLSTNITKASNNLKSVYSKLRTYPFINTYFGSSISDEKLDEVVNIINENISAELKMIKRKRIDELRDDENYVSKMRKLPENIDASKRVIEFIESDESVVEYFYNEKYPDFSIASDREIVQFWYPEIYSRYREKVDKNQKKRFAIQCNIIDTISDSIEEYYNQNIDLLEFMRITKKTNIKNYIDNVVKGFNNYNSRFIKRFFYKHYLHHYKKPFYLKQALEEKISYSDGTVVSEESKINAFDYMSRNNLPYIQYVYSRLIRLIHRGELDLDIPFIENDIFLPSKEGK